MANTTQAKRERMSEQASAAAKNVQDVGAKAREMASESVDSLRETANQYLDEGRQRVRELGDTVQHRVQDRPMTSILIATAIGFLLGVLWVRR